MNLLADVAVVPYTVHDGMPNFRDSEIKALYARMEADGTAGVVFYDDAITTSDEFLRFMKHGFNQLFLVYSGSVVSGIIWLNRFQNRYAQMHWCVFSNMWGEGNVAFGSEAVRQVLDMKHPDGRYILDMVLGIVPGHNERAIKYAIQCGGKVLGMLPHAALKEGEACPGAVIYYVRRAKED